MKYFICLIFISIQLCLSCKNKELKPKSIVIENDIKPLNKIIYQVHLKQFSAYFLPDSCNCQMNIDLLSGGYLKLNLKDCRGEMSFKFIDTIKKNEIEGQYINSLDTLKRYSYERSAIDGNEDISILQYFEPLPNGIWKYFKKGKIIKEEYYEKGIEKKMP